MFRIALMFGLLVGVSPVLADAIDGEWCNDTIGQVRIVGSQIITPAGAAVRGRYERHAFAYQVPAGEADAGKLVYMMMQSEDDMSSYVFEGKIPGPPHPWRRCALKPKTS